jgi:hypothetical protein
MTFPHFILMKTIIGIVLIVAGAIIFFQGLNRKDSLAGRAASAGTEIANAVDGGVRTPRHVGYMVAGGVLVLAGIGVIAKRTPPALNR